MLGSGVCEEEHGIVFHFLFFLDPKLKIVSGKFQSRGNILGTVELWNWYMDYGDKFEFFI